MNEPRRVAKPSLIAQIPSDGHAVIEASAGTGKTYTLEHLIIELLLTTEAKITEILVVTFTDKATSELKRRVRSKIVSLLRVEDDTSCPEETPHWVLNAGARQRLQAALIDFDAAPISTIHGFCDRILLGYAFLHLGLFEQTPMDERSLFSEAFLDALRTELAENDAFVEYLTTWLDERDSTVEDLETLLFDAHKFACPIEPVYSPERMDQALENVATLELDTSAFKKTLKALGTHGNTTNALLRHFGRLQEVVRGHTGSRAALLLKLADVNLPYILTKLDEIAPQEDPPRQVHEVSRAVARCAVSLSAACAQTFLPVLASRLHTLKEETARYDFQDMLSRVASSLDGPYGEALVQALRRQYHYALVDEFQDTDSLQWRIFRRIFFKSGGQNPLYVIGDPKQAIYGFRGADVHAYLTAQREILEAGGTDLALTDNFRSTPLLIQALNEVFGEHDTGPFFTGGIRFRHPATPGRPDLRLLDEDGSDAVPVAVFRLTWPEDGASMREVRETLAARIASEIADLVADGQPDLRLASATEEDPIRAEDIFVLTRSGRDGQEVGAALEKLGIPHVYYKQEGLFQTDEARDVRDLLAAIERPLDRSRRARALVTPFFGLGLSDVAGLGELPEGHPLLERLETWRELARAQDYAALFNDIVDESGILGRELFLKESERSTTNSTHVLETLLREVHRAPCTLRELIRKLDGYISGRVLPEAESGDVQRLESDADAVQIMTMHMAKGLEAAVVFVYGGFWPPPDGEVHTYYREGDRRTWVGRLGDAPEEVRSAVAEEEAAEDQRLLYVALTRAKGRIYLPYFQPFLDRSARGGPRAKEILGNGCYKQLNDRLRLLLSQPELDPSLFSVEDVGCFRLYGLRKDGGGRCRPLDWEPPAGLIPDYDPTKEFRALRGEHRPLFVTSYSRMKALQGSEPVPVVKPELGADELPGGIRSGLLLHEVLEQLNFESVRDAPSLEAWQEEPSVKRLFERALLRFDIDRTHLAHSQQLVYASLTTPVRLRGESLAGGLASVEHPLKEIEFVYPYVESSSAGEPIERGFVKGFVDLVFTHAGLTYFLDWKSDVLPAWDDQSLRAHVRHAYELQAQLYSIALVKMLDIRSAAEYEARFGGYLYCFLRGMAAKSDGRSGVYFERPSWERVLNWKEEIAAST